MRARCLPTMAILAGALTGAAAAFAQTAPDPGAPRLAIEGSLTAVAQRTGAQASADGMGRLRASSRGDLSLERPLAEGPRMALRGFAQLRFGWGEGLQLRPTYTGSANSAAFEVAGDPDPAVAVLAQAGLQLEWPLPAASAGGQPSTRALLTLGKLDAFGFFDGNAIADDEATRFLNNAFVHNPLLDSGGDTGADDFGFAPGLVLQFQHDRTEATGWTLALGAFGAGPGARFSGSQARPFLIAQAEARLHLGRHPGSYRLYAWTNGQASGFDGVTRRHTGVGLSVDQPLTPSLTVFGRWGHQIRGEPRVDRALTLGGEWAGHAWGRADDALGLAWGRLRTAPAFGAASASVDADGDGAPDWGYAASGAETLVEVFYRLDLGHGLQLTPDLQWIRRPGGDGSAPTLRVWGLRAHWAF